MAVQLTDLQPEAIWRHFYGITRVPRPSKKEGKILDYLKKVISDLGYDFVQDETGNIVVRKPATPGYENAPTVLIQGHVDMVCEKNKGTEHDFDNDPIKAFVDGDWVKADGTTLGADNGIGMAAALAVLEAKDLVHPPMEFLFTVDEETGLTGAKGLKPGFLKADIMLNLDSEEDGTLYVGCAGGMDTAGIMKMNVVDVPAGYTPVEIMVSGLKGGHSGLDIHTGRGNAIKFLTRTLADLAQQVDLKLSTISGGSKRNAIPREAECIVYVPETSIETVLKRVQELNNIFLDEIRTVEPGLELTATKTEGNGKALSQTQCETLLDTLYALPHGVIKMSADIPGLVETSTNLATITQESDTITVGTSQRSSVETEKQDIVNQVIAVFRLAGLEVESGDGYPGWKPNMKSIALQYVKESYRDLFGEDPEIKAIHAGLECGLISEVFPNMDMISFGPTIQGAHSPEEKVSIKAVQRFWNLVVDVLQRIAQTAGNKHAS
ncbi:MAG: aminoacyl-histidine dipeptidase [Chlorobi bacterium]|nr:aminoacyl-histidine dipeptidase [Chlorobiota bacterium]